MAKTHELGLSFKTLGKVTRKVAWAAMKFAVQLEETTFFEQPHFWHTIKVAPGTPLHSRAYTGEIDGEFRYANTHVLRITPGCGLVVGSWQPKPEELDETDMLLRATNVDHGRADEQSTEFDSAVVGLAAADRINLPLAPQSGTDTGCCGSCGCK